MKMGGPPSKKRGTRGEHAQSTWNQPSRLMLDRVLQHAKYPLAGAHDLPYILSASLRLNGYIALKLIKINWCLTWIYTRAWLVGPSIHITCFFFFTLPVHRGGGPSMCFTVNYLFSSILTRLIGIDLSFLILDFIPWVIF